MTKKALEKLFIPHHLAILAKQKGFNEECIAWHDKLKGRPELDQFHLFDKEYFLDKKTICTNSSLGNTYMITAPSHKQIIDWLRKKKIGIVEAPTGFKDSWICINYSKTNSKYTGFLTIDKAIETGLELLPNGSIFDELNKAVIKKLKKSLK